MDASAAADDALSPPEGRIDTHAQPATQTDGPTRIMPNVVGVRSDDQLQQFLADNRSGTAMVNFGSSWCSHCHAMLPPFLSLAKRHPGVQFAVAQVDYLQDVSGVTHTPTFTVYKKGAKVDQFFGANEQQLKDHLWLHMD